MDIGEGTYAQLVRTYGPKLDVWLRNVKAVHISHIHADHHLGLVMLLEERDKVLGKYNANLVSILSFGMCDKI